MTLPNSLTKSGLILGIVFHILLGWLTLGNWAGVANNLLTAIGGTVLGLWLLDAIAILGLILLGKEAMGGGDVKLAAMMGAWLGWQYLPLAIFIAAVVCILVEKQKWGQKKPIPFGPFLALGAAITIFSGEAILSTYLQFFKGA